MYSVLRMFGFLWTVCKINYLNLDLDLDLALNISRSGSGLSLVPFLCCSYKINSQTVCYLTDTHLLFFAANKDIYAKKAIIQPQFPCSNGLWDFWSSTHFRFRLWREWKGSLLFWWIKSYLNTIFLLQSTFKCSLTYSVKDHNKQSVGVYLSLDSKHHFLCNVIGNFSRLQELFHFFFHFILYDSWMNLI